MREQQRERAPQHRGAAVAGKLYHVLTGVRMRPAHIGKQRLIDGIATFRIDHQAQVCPVALPTAPLLPPKTALANGERLTAAEPHNPDCPLARRRRHGGNRILKVH